MISKKIYFDNTKRALGTVDDYYGDYFASEVLTIPNDYKVVGRHYNEILEAGREARRAAMREKYAPTAGSLTTEGYTIPPVGTITPDDATELIEEKYYDEEELKLDDDVWHLQHPDWEPVPDDAGHRPCRCEDYPCCGH